MFPATRRTTFSTLVIATVCFAPGAHTARGPASASSPAPSRVAAAPVDAAEAQAPTVPAGYLRLPLRFEPRTQADRLDTDFVARGLGYAVRVSSNGARVTLGPPRGQQRAETITLRLVASRPDRSATPLERQAGESHHYAGHDPRQWRTGVASYARVAYRDVYPGIDVVYYGNQRQLEYDFVVAPGADPSRIGIAIDGARGVRLDHDGNLVITTSAGTLTQRAPVVYQDVDGARRAVDGSFSLRDNGEIGFRIGEHDASLPLVIDPVLNYSTYLGGTSQDLIHAVAVDGAGHIIVAGETYSDDFPASNARQPQRAGHGDAFVARLTPAGDALVYATYLGGASWEAAHAIDLDGTGAAYVAGATNSWDFPATSQFQTNPNNGTSDAFVFKLDAQGLLEYSTLLGGSLEEYALGVAVDGAGRAHLAGSTASADLPVSLNARQAALGGSPVFRTTNGGDSWAGQSSGLRATGVNAFAIDPSNPDTVYAGTQFEGVFKSTDGGASWALAGTSLFQQQITSLALGDGSPAVVYAASNSGAFRSEDGGSSWFQMPVQGSVNAIGAVTNTGGAPVLYASVSRSLYASSLLKSTDGGNNWVETALTDDVHSISVSGSTVYVATTAGVFTSMDGEIWSLVNSGLVLPITRVVADPSNPWVAYAAGEGLYRTNDGGGSWQFFESLGAMQISTIGVAPSDPATLCISTFFGSAITNDGGENWRPTHESNVVATAVAFHPQAATTIYLGLMMNRDAFVATIGADGGSLDYASYFGGASHDEAADIAIGPGGSRVIVGKTNSADLPVLGALQSTLRGIQNAFVSRFASDWSLTYSTYLGGSWFESAPKLALDSLGQAHVAGLTWSSDFPVVNAHQPQPAGGFPDVFVSVLNASGSGLLYSTYLGGSGMDTNSTASFGPDVAVTGQGDTYVTGTTRSQNFPTTADALQAMHGGGLEDAFLSRFDPAGVLAYSTYLGGDGGDYGRALTVDGQGLAVLAGYTSSLDFPLRNPLQAAAGGSDEGFIARIGDAAPPDTTAPESTIALSGTAGAGGWYRSPVVVTLSATDGDGSGVAAIHYRLDAGLFQAYAQPFTIAAQGSTRVTVQATDVAGNVEAPHSVTAMIDTANPVVAIAAPQAREYLPNQVLTVSTSASDALSGLAGPVALTLDGSALAGSTIDLSSVGLGAHTLVATATDRAGNTAQASVTFTVVTVLDTVIHVPAEAATIQAAIDGAYDGFTVLVAPGTYHERIDFRGKAIVVTSEAGAGSTIIDAGGAGSVVTFSSGEPRAAVLSGFTVRNGASIHAGGGVYIANSSPTVRDNVVTGNRSCTGVGVYSYFSSPLIQRNRIVGNTIQGCTGGWGIGIYVGGNSSAELVDNEIADNTGGAASGGGIALFAAGTVVVQGNLIARNVTNGVGGCGYGGGIAAANFVQAKVVNNLIVGNAACSGGGIYWTGSVGANVFVNNTIAGNAATVSYQGIYASGFDSRNQLHNNIITAASGAALYCQNAPAVPSPVLNANDVFTAAGDAYGGACLDRTGQDGNISADPRFVDAAAGDYRATMESPVVDTGNDAAPGLPATDLPGQPRTVDGDADGTPHVDMGAFEYRNRAPVVNAGSDRTVDAGADCVGRLTLTATASDADGDPLTFTWTGPFGTVSGPSAVLALPPGTHVITVIARDANGGSGSDTVVVTVRDATAPAIASVTASPSVLMRANREMVPVTVTVSAADGCGGPVTCRIVSVASNEPVQGNGGASDWEITGDLTVTLRAERSGRGDGRVYTITVECVDTSGNKSTSTATVTVPR